MNLLFYVPQMAVYGGMERHVCVLAEESIKRGHRVRLLTTSNSLNDEARNSLRRRGVDFRELGRHREGASSVVKYFWLVSQIMRATPRRWDVIYTNGQSALASVVWKAARRRTRIIHHHHTAADAQEQKTWAPGFWQVLRRAPEIVACSQATRDNIALAIQRPSIRFLPYFTISPVARSQVVEKTYLPGQPLNFGFVGRLVESKGIGTLCELSRRPELASVTWHLHGAGPAYPESHFEQYPQIRYHGSYRDPDTYRRILLELDALALFTQHNEGMPLSLIEATSAGLPWIASDRGGTKEIALSPINCVLVSNPADLDQVRADTLELVRRIQSGQTSRLAQRAVYDSHFAPEVVARKWFDYLEATPAAI